MTYNFRFYAVRTNPKRENRVAEDIMRIGKRMGHDLEQVLHHPTTKGYVYVECRNQEQLEEILALVPSSKGVVGEIPSAQIESLFTAEPTIDELKVFEPVLIAQGPNKGQKGILERIDGNEAFVKVDDGLMSRRLNVPIGWLERSK